jgi:hypothetical protein
MKKFLPAVLLIAGFAFAVSGQQVIRVEIITIILMAPQAHALTQPDLQL